MKNMKTVSAKKEESNVISIQVKPRLPVAIMIRLAKRSQREAVKGYNRKDKSWRND